MRRILVSYSSEDKKFATRLANNIYGELLTPFEILHDPDPDDASKDVLVLALLSAERRVRNETILASGPWATGVWGFKPA